MDSKDKLTTPNPIPAGSSNDVHKVVFESKTQRLPSMIEIPKTATEIAELLTKYPTHPGLLTAHSSILKNRHPFEAILILLGITGTGKSSTVNEIIIKIYNIFLNINCKASYEQLDESTRVMTSFLLSLYKFIDTTFFLQVNSVFNRKVAQTGDERSVSSDIVEYNVQIPLPDLGVSNSKLTIVDTPGFGDTRDVNLDPQLLASLHRYFESRASNTPTCILITTRFDDKRFSGENSPFVRMLKAVESLIDGHGCLRDVSIVFVFTHFMNGKKAERQNPRERLELFSKVIQEYTRFTNPILLVAENEAEEHEMELGQNGFYKLPNGDYYPYNVFKGIQAAIFTSNPMGEAIIRAFYKGGRKYHVSVNDPIKLVLLGDRAVTACENILAEISNPILKCEVNDMLFDSWKQLFPGAMEREDQNLLRTVQRTFQRKGIRTLDNVPGEPEVIMRLVQELPENQKLISLLENSLGLRISKLDVDVQTGYCFNVLQDTLLSTSIFQKSTGVKLSPLGFLVPDNLICQKYTERKDICDIFNSLDEYQSSRFQDLGVSIGRSWKALTAEGSLKTRSGYNIQSSSKLQNFTATREFRIFSLTLPNDPIPPFSPEFENYVKSLKPFDSKNPAVVSSYKNFFAQFGTHVVVNCFGGGVLEITAKSKSDNQSKTDLCTIQSGLSFALLKMFDTSGHFDSKSSKEFQQLQQEFTMSTKTRGGKYSHSHALNPSTMTRESGSEIVKWQESLMENPMMLQTEMHLLPLSFFARKVDESRGNEIAIAFKKLFQIDFDLGVDSCENVQMVVPLPRELEPEPNVGVLQRIAAYGTLATAGCLSGFGLLVSSPFVVARKCISLFRKDDNFEMVDAFFDISYGIVAGTIAVCYSTFGGYRNFLKALRG